MSKEYYLKNREKIAEQSRQYYQKNKSKILKRHHERREKYPEEVRATEQRYREKNRDELRKRGRKYRQIVLDHYGCKCQWPAGCEITDPDMLQVDHINGGGNLHRKQINKSLFDWLIQNDFPPGFRLLCANHNFKHRVIMLREKRESER